MDTYYRSSDYILQVWFESEEDFQVVQIKFDEKTFMGFRKATILVLQIKFEAAHIKGELGFVAIDDLTIAVLEAGANAGVECPQLPGHGHGHWSLVASLLQYWSPIEICHSCVANRKTSKFQ